MTNETKVVYEVSDIQKLLGLGRNSVYIFLEETYKHQKPFRVVKVGKLYKVPKNSFDLWIKGEGNTTN